jgi:ABC-type nitrate/sulfonate/bicarbonate transport system substrate-binding protein
LGGSAEADDAQTHIAGEKHIRSMWDLKGKSVGAFATPEVLDMMAAYVGLDPKKDLNWVRDPNVQPFQLFVEGKLDAYLAFPPEPQMLRARSFGHVIVNTAVDRPWSQYFCCTLGAPREFIRKNPVATKRVLRAILKAADLCASDPPVAGRRMVDGGFTPRYDYALQTLPAPGLRWGGAARDAPRPSRASGADRRRSPAAAGTAAPQVKLGVIEIFRQWPAHPGGAGPAEITAHRSLA